MNIEYKYITEGMNYFNKLITNNTGVSSKSFFLVVITIIGLILLFIPVIILLVEIFYNHTINTNLYGLAAYIGSVAGIFASAGITKAWSERYEYHNFNPHYRLPMTRADDTDNISNKDNDTQVSNNIDDSKVGNIENNLSK